ncbi:succinyl-diaminopimelate desuccinylase [Streptomyces purpurascens]|uniref:succinyl-diaminopimelate desuccinylase n=1 Tax=Streptomyces purpurascens TaxID=1924 RepID=UPI001675755D|nr:succinyl-diaminopimelate desuccinylase [Streptomyces purpurascens]MCE7049631.1 succinyl-diaminopimelate desuccinylase [Streptomyces purpurascens]GHA44477.1 succinyl-diaminopimelate desuccinylase [Streptomyces purpurascens]
MIPLDPAANPVDLVDLVDLTRALVDTPSESGDEAGLADAVESALRAHPHLGVVRVGNSVVARTDTGRAERVIIAGHLDTVPAAGNLPSRLDGERLYGLGACDMKGGVAIALRLAAGLAAPVRDVTYVFYECEEVAGDRNGLKRIAADRPDLLEADLAILMEPSDAGVEAGCQGVLNADITVRGERAHTARSWMGVNAAHRAAAALRRLDDHSAERIVIDGLEYREGLNAVAVRAGIADNVVPDTCVISVNLRFAPSRSPEQAEAYLRALFPEYEVEVTEVVPGALPGLGQGPVASLVEALGAVPRPKLGWTDVARFTALGTPALNYGPGDPTLAHTAGEYVPIGQLRECERRLAAWLSG